MTNHSEGVSKIPVRNILKKAPSEGGFGLDTNQAGTFFTNVALGWYIKALLGFVTDRIPIFGYRRKSWLVISLVMSSIAWIYIALSGSTNQSSLFLGLIVVNIFVAFSDVVCDGLMVQTAQKIENRYDLPEGTENRAFQVSQWSGAMVAILIAAIAGGVIAQLFDLRTSAVISCIMPFALAVLILFFVKEEKVSFDFEKAKVGFKAIGVTIVVAGLILWLKNTGKDAPAWQTAIAGWEWILSPILILGSILVLFRPPTMIIIPTVLIFLWQFSPFSTDSQWFYQYITADNTAITKALENDQFLIPVLKQICIAMKMTTAQEIAKSGFQEVFFGSVFIALQAISSIVALWFFYKFWKDRHFTEIFQKCIVAMALTIGLYLAMVGFEAFNPYYIILCTLITGFTVMLAGIAIMSYAAGNIPREDQATTFAFFMGMSNLGVVLGGERLGGWLYIVFGKQLETVKAVTAPDGVITQEVVKTLTAPNEGLVGIAIVSLTILVALFIFVTFLGRRERAKN